MPSEIGLPGEVLSALAKMNRFLATCPGMEGVVHIRVPTSKDRIREQQNVKEKQGSSILAALRPKAPARKVVPKLGQ